jgi:solute carrier family 24 (sodium/potassium/calcium exchanger), member 6
MYLLASTADDYLSNSLEFIVTTFKIPESLAGVTILAFGNGAPDIFASINNAEKLESPDSSPSMNDSYSGLIGAAFFLGSVVLTLCIRASPGQEIRVTKTYFLREYGFLILVYVYLILIFLGIGFINLWITLGFFLIYIVYVTIVVIQSSMKSAPGDTDRSTSVKQQIEAN